MVVLVSGSYALSDAQNYGKANSRYDIAVFSAPTVIKEVEDNH